MRTTIKTTIRKMTTVAALGLALSACGGGSGGNDAEIGKFTGTWTTVSGTTTMTCPEGTYTTAASGQVEWSRGVSTDLVQSTPPCIIDAEAAGSTATGSGPTCTFSNAAGDALTLTITSYTFVVAPDGQTAQENAAGTMVDNSTNGATETCSVNETASYQKLSK